MLNVMESLINNLKQQIRQIIYALYADQKTSRKDCLIEYGVVYDPVSL